MGGDIWPAVTTRHARYCDSPNDPQNDAVIGMYVLLYSLIGPKRRLNVLDVGCSTGSAARHLKGYLKALGVECVVIGMDASRRVMADAELNLDGFRLGNLFDAPAEPAYDIVICSRLLRFLDPPRQCDGVSRCARFCNDRGMVITDGIPDSCYAISGHVMLPRAVILGETARRMEGWNGKTGLCKRLVRFRAHLEILFSHLALPIALLCAWHDRKARINCPYCRGSWAADVRI